MLNKRILLFLSILTILNIEKADAQNSTNSPYSRYGYGQLTDPVNISSRGMGGTAYATRGSLQPNFMNPASYSAVDSMTFIFDISASGYCATYSEGGKKENYFNGNLDYITMQFPVAKNIGVSLGLVPYSTVGYNYGTMDTQGSNSTLMYQGSGGISQAYLGSSIKLFKKLSLGFNASYLFGVTDRSFTPMFSDPLIPSYGWVEHQRVSDIKFDLGAQYTHDFAGAKQLTIGAVFSPKNKLNNTLTKYIPQPIGDAITDTVKNSFDIPMNIGVGINYKWRNKFTLAADFQYQDWTNARYKYKSSEDETGQFNNRYRGAIGFEYVPNIFDRSYSNKIRYRVGVNYNQSYLKVNESAVNEFGVSIGAGFPLRTGRSSVNVALEYIKLATPNAAYLKEDYIKLTFNITINEFWFFKNRIN